MQQGLIKFDRFLNCYSMPGLVDEGGTQEVEQELPLVSVEQTHLPTHLMPQVCSMVVRSPDH